jgi:cytochrome c oxidase subunit II
VGRTATIIAISYLVATALATLFVVVIAGAARGERKIEVRRLSEREKTWLIAASLLLTALLLATIFFTPYGRSAGPDAQIVNVKAVQFAWVMPETTIHAGRQVEFRLTSGDVNHNFAVYTMSWKLLFQVQVVPGRTQAYVYTFERPGMYRVACLEFCGLGHHLMQARFAVRP